METGEVEQEQQQRAHPGQPERALGQQLRVSPDRGRDPRVGAQGAAAVVRRGGPGRRVAPRDGAVGQGQRLGPAADDVRDQAGVGQRVVDVVVARAAAELQPGAGEPGADQRGLGQALRGRVHGPGEREHHQVGGVDLRREHGDRADGGDRELQQVAGRGRAAADPRQVQVTGGPGRRRLVRQAGLAGPGGGRRRRDRGRGRGRRRGRLGLVLGGRVRRRTRLAAGLGRRRGPAAATTAGLGRAATAGRHGRPDRSGRADRIGGRGGAGRAPVRDCGAGHAEGRVRGQDDRAADGRRTAGGREHPHCPHAPTGYVQPSSQVPKSFSNTRNKLTATRGWRGD